MADEIDVLESDDELENLPCYSRMNKPKPIVIKGIGQLTVYVFAHMHCAKRKQHL